MLHRLTLSIVALGVLAGCGGIAIEPADGGHPASGSSGGNSGTVVGGSSTGGSASSTGGSTGGSSSSGGFDDAGVFFDASTGDDSSTVGTDASPACGVTPTLHVNTPGSMYCGYSSTGTMLTCQTGAQCCLGGPLGGGMYAPQECDPWTGGGSGCMNPVGGGAIGIACNQIADCAANGFTGTIACCLQGATVPAMPAGCDYLKSTHGTAIVCEDVGDSGVTAGTCAAGEVQICSADVDCPSGMQCVPGKWKIFEVGFCQ
jgi:hypothetical protein